MDSEAAVSHGTSPVWANSLKFQLPIVPNLPDEAQTCVPKRNNHFRIAVHFMQIGEMAGL